MCTAYILNSNTPLLVDTCIRSILKNSKDCIERCVIVDSSSTRPFQMPWIDYDIQVDIIDNTKGRFFNTDEELKKHPLVNGNAKRNNYGSARHASLVQHIIDVADQPFVLLDCDFIVKNSLSILVDREYAASGCVQSKGTSCPRLMPCCMFINPGTCKKFGCNFYDPYNMLGIGYDNRRPECDTGASFLSELNNAKAPIKEVALDALGDHMGSSISRSYDYYRSYVNARRSYWTDDPQFGVVDMLRLFHYDATDRDVVNISNVADAKIGNGHCVALHRANFGCTVYDQCARSHGSAGIDAAVKAMSERYGKGCCYVTYLKKEKYLYGKFAFNMSRSDFDSLCNFMFPLLVEVGKVRSEDDLNIYHVAERLASAWVVSKMTVDREV